MAGSNVSYRGLLEARKKFDELAVRLASVASGAVVQRAAQAVQAQVSAIAKRVTTAHTATGAAASSLVVAASSGSVQLTSNRYLRYHAWWPFRRGMPLPVVKRAVKIFEEELRSAITGRPSLLALQDAAADEIAEGKRAKAERRRARTEARSAAAIARSTAKKARTQALHESKIAKIRAKGDARSAKHEARMAKFRARVTAKNARHEAKLNRSRAKFQRDTARQARKEARRRG